MVYLYAINIQHIPLNYYLSYTKRKQVWGWVFFFFSCFVCLLNAGWHWILAVPPRMTELFGLERSSNGHLVQPRSKTKKIYNLSGNLVLMPNHFPLLLFFLFSFYLLEASPVST